MEASVKYLLDTCILIDYLRGEPNVYDLLAGDAAASLSMSTITMMELIIGAFNKREVRYIQKAFAKINTVYVSEDISIKAEELIVEYSKSHNLQIDDAIIAATALKMDTELITYNVSDFSFVPNIKLYQFG